MKNLTSIDGTPSGHFAFGTMQFGGKADTFQSREMFDASRVAGITHFDTAYVYTDGASETLLGEMIKDERETLLIASKFGSTGGASKANMRSQFDTSRRRLGLDMIDVLYLHQFDLDTDPQETMQGFAELRQSGQIRYIGLSNFAAWQVVHWVQVAAEFDLEIDIIQPMYNLVKRQAEVEILPMSTHQGIAVAPYSPLGGGLLTGKYATGAGGRIRDNEQYAARYRDKALFQVAVDLAELAQHHGISPATLAVAWVAANTHGPTPIISARNVEQLRPSLDAIRYDLSPDLYTQICALSPTPPPATDRSENQT